LCEDLVLDCLGASGQGLVEGGEGGEWCFLGVRQGQDGEEGEEGGWTHGCGWAQRVEWALEEKWRLL
jgi:hypothetical protein